MLTLESSSPWRPLKVPFTIHGVALGAAPGGDCCLEAEKVLAAEVSFEEFEPLELIESPVQDPRGEIIISTKMVDLVERRSILEATILLLAL